MTKNDFLLKLSAVLEDNQISDAAEIVSEYEQHFAFKLADGYSEEEIAAKLGDPEQLAAQFERMDESTPRRRSIILTKIGLAFVNLFAGIFFLLLGICGVVIAGISLAIAAYGVCLIGGITPFSFLPLFPYWCGAILGASVMALAVLAAVGCIYYWALVRQLIRSFIRFQHNVLATVSGKPGLPSLPAHVRFSAKANRRLRSIALISLMAFAVCFVLGYIACMLSAGAFEFWHTWGWFGYTGE